MKTVVIKCGGSVLEELSEQFFTSLQELMDDGYSPVIVHGGGPAINKMLDLYGIPAQFVDGLRVTCEKTMEVVEMVLSGKTNRQLCSLMKNNGFLSLGINGSDGLCLQAEYIDKQKLGYVGEIRDVNTRLIGMVIENGYIPVITPIGIAEDGSRLNINGDYAAASIAKAMKAGHCAFVTNVDGILIGGKLISELNESEAENHISDGSIHGGMVPKVQSALSAAAAGAGKVMIISGKKPFYKNNSWHGTAIVAAEGELR
ncbi:acetylglutamate kinase [Mesobacillus subterraneus]|uniref:Acetylglutamate kinase n=1 Tax=Mesobacillus subterraneus TaxID=285983 RepID=A0A3R9FLT5_9BACI|nr:acetylglutamate kinase [Mesobacillus subterraneus]RSD29376.1 acetylglutamate kinase [Mesobacillus subterraneus]